MSTTLDHLIDHIQTAAAEKRPLNIQGANTKQFYGQPAQGDPFEVKAHEGITSYEPTELVVTARCGTPLRDLEAVLAERGQHLAFEPPRFGFHGGTVGGMMAAGLSGPARASSGAVRDHVLGASLLNARGEVLHFGGTVMKNVAGYDVSRLLAGSMGTLGVILEVSLKVLPIAPATATLRFDCDQPTAIDMLNRWGGHPLPLSASAWWDGTLVLRLRGAEAAVQAAMHTLGGELIDAGQAELFWRGLRDQSDTFFVNAQNAAERGVALWRVSVPPATPPLVFSGEQLIEWHGAQRWVSTATPAGLVREAATQAGGYATLFMAKDKSPGAFTPPAAPLADVHRRLKASFDPDGRFNPGRLYPGL